MLCVLQEAIISHGCTVKSSSISSAVVGLRSHIEEGCTIDVSSRCAGSAPAGGVVCTAANLSSNAGGQLTAVQLVEAWVRLLAIQNSALLPLVSLLHLPSFAPVHLAVWLLTLLCLVYHLCCSTR